MRSTKHALLDEVVREWQSLPQASRPWGVWVRQYPAISSEVHKIDDSVLPEAVWFLDDHGLEWRDVWQWMRFVAVHIEQLWCGKMWAKESDRIFGDPHMIGLAAFAPCTVEGVFYLETIWGGKFGGGRQVSVSTEGCVQHDLTIWKS